MEYKYFLTIDKDNEFNSKSPIKGTIWNITKRHPVQEDGSVHIDDFCFNPLTIFNDIRFIQENLQLEESEKNSQQSIQNSFMHLMIMNHVLI